MTSYVTLKDLARCTQLSVRSVKRWAVRLGVPPTKPGHASHRWSESDAHLFLKRWEKANHARPH